MKAVLAERPARLLELDEDLCRAQFDRSSFMISHHLTEHPLLEFKRLFELVRVRKENRQDIYWDMGDIGINQRWDQTPPRSLSVDEAFERIERANAWIILRHVHKDPGYLALLEKCMEEVERASGVDFKRYVKLKDAIIFITSPRRITSYHIDRECSFLLQIRGDKTLYVFDRNDREVLPETELERFWTVDNNAPRYREQFQSRAATYALEPGKAVHIPVNAPHWLKNGEGVSISLNINFHYRDFVRADLYRANYVLRRCGLRPGPPGHAPGRDTLKRVFIGKPFSAAKSVVSTLKHSISSSKRKNGDDD